jgi:hypothetical protein
MTEVVNESDYARVLRLARIRQKHWYNRNVKKVSENRRKDRELFKELKQQAGITTISRNLPVETEPVENNIQEPDPEPEEPVLEVAKFTTLTNNQIKKIKKVQTKSKQTKAGIIAHLSVYITKNNGSMGSLPSYKTMINQFYEMTDTDVNKPLNLNNPQVLFQTLDNYKKPDGSEYAIDRKAGWAQMLYMLADEKNGFKLEVIPASFEIYKNKHNELQIIKRDNQTNNQTKNSKKIILFSNILKKCLEIYGRNSKEFLYLRLYQLASLRDNFKLLIIITDPKDAVSKSHNYIVIPPIIKKKVKNKMIVFKPEGSLIINTYKTEKQGYLKLPFLLTEETTNLVRAYMERNNLKVGEYLFGKSAMSAWVGLLLRGLGIEQKGSNINYIRKAVSTEYHLLNPNAPAKDRLLFAERMAHSVDMNKGYVRLISEQKL